MPERDKKGDVFGIAPAVARRLVEWADEKRTLAAEREEKFKERDGVIDQIREAKLGDGKGNVDDKHLEELKAEAYDVIESIKELDRALKYLTTKIDATLCDPKIRSQDVTDPDVLGPVKVPPPETKRAKDDGQLMIDSADKPPASRGSLEDVFEIDEADSALLGDYEGFGKAQPAATWTSHRWDSAPFDRKRKLDVELGGRWYATTDQVGGAALKVQIATPKALLDELTLVFVAGQHEWRDETLSLDAARFLLNECARHHLREPSATFGGFCSAFVAEGKLDVLRDLSPLAAAIAERDREIAGEGDGTLEAPAGPQGGGSGQAKKRAAAAKAGGKGRKKAA